ncbi:hypothetical protein BGW39_004787 [Mortierella sp. 14UC]|nr:hypothetical protein BGW39_004787 [Mortierella sp. 14UC]
MFGYPSGIVIPGPGFEEAKLAKGAGTASTKSGSSSIRSASTSHSDILFGVYNSNTSITTATSSSTSNANGHYGHPTRNGSISSVLTGGNGPPSPTSTFASNGVGNNSYYRGGGGGGMASLAEEDQPPPYVPRQHQQQHTAQQPPPQQAAPSEDYRQCLQWLQQTCRPVFMKELTQLNTVPVPITPANAKHPSHIGGTQLVQIASWKQSQVQVLPLDRWGQAHDVLEEGLYPGLHF